MGFEEAMDAIARGVEVLGIMTIVLGLAAALVRAGLALLGGQGGEEGYRIVRTVFGVASCWDWSSLSRPTSSRPSLSSLPSRTSLSWG
jgi:hypothetical protein